MTPLELLDALFAFARAKIVGAADAEPDLATPCRDWTLRQLVNHVIASADGFGGMVDGSSTEFDVEAWAETPFAGDDPVVAYDAAVAHALAAFGAPGALEGTVSVGPREAPVAMMVYACAGDALLHGWDLAKATGQDTALPEAPAAEVLAFMERMSGGDAPRPNFDPPVPVPDDASVGDRLVGLSGRRP